MTTLQRHRLALILVALTLSAGCIHRTFESDLARHAYQADEVVLRVNELQSATIAAASTNAVSIDTARIIVRFTVAANQVLKASPSGWQASVSLAWNQLKQELAALNNPTIESAMRALDLILAAYGGQ